MVDDAQKARPHKIDGKVVDTKRAMPREVCFVPNWLFLGQNLVMKELTS